MPLPERLVVLGVPWRISQNPLEADEDKRTIGYTHPLQDAVWINPDLPVERSRQAVSHEFLHVLADTIWQEKSADHFSEEAITALAPLMLHTMRENPALMHFLLEDALWVPVQKEGVDDNRLWGAPLHLPS